MAGGKVGPRQKMINMMYLVLTALLALNVSAEILNAFDTIRDKLEISADGAEQSSIGAADALKAQVDKELAQKQNQNEAIKGKVDEIREQTKAMITYIDNLDSLLLLRPGIKDSKTGEINASETERNFTFFMGEGKAAEGRGSGEAKKLRDKLDEYFSMLAKSHAEYKQEGDVDWVETAYKIQDPAASKSHEGEGVKKSWEHHNFEGPIVANRAMLQALKSDIYSKENLVYNDLAKKLGLKIQDIKENIPAPPPPPPIPEKALKPDGVVVLFSPESKIVVTGLQYKAKLYVGLISKDGSKKPTFKSSMGTLTPTAEGAEVTIPSSASSIPANAKEAKISYTVDVSVPTIDGKVLPGQGKAEFIVRKPEIVVTSATIQILYRECGNMVNIDVPALGDLYNPVCTVSAGTIKQSADSKKKFLIVPTGDKCRVNVSSNTNGSTMNIGFVDYKVIDPPKPSIMVKVNGIPYSPSMGVNKGSKMSLSIQPDNEFKGALPNDAKYSFDEVNIFKQSGLGPPQRVGGAPLMSKDGVAGIEVPIPTDAFANPGAKVYVEFKDVYRKNFQGQSIKDPRFTPYEKTIVLVTK